ncbi:MAG: FAD-binding protein [Candidatus Lernaella stagnicola]|nr:FAD-binding protein [Candidatus Lernaella stagnicola]
MGYTQEMLDLIKRVEATRSERVAGAREGKDFPPLSLEERTERLKYHPDYKEEGRRPLACGVSKDYAICHEIADLLEAAPLVEPGVVDVTEADYTTDVLVIGGGGAGTSAALLAAEAGVRVILATKLRHGDANTMMAEGGIQAATKVGWDSPYFHYLDVIGGGHFKNPPELVRTLVTEAPLVIEWLEGMGCLLSKESDEDGTLRTAHGGGTCRKRMHFAADITGAEIMRTLRDEARNRADRIEVLEFNPAVELILNDKGHCCGALLFNLETREPYVVHAKAVVMATGGSGRLHVQGFMTTNHYGATGDGLVMAYRAGVPVTFLHAVQYHPTGAVFPEQAEGLLITEKVRGFGAHILNVEGNQFVFEREPRDVEAASIIRECGKVGKGVPTPTGKFGAWLDSPMIEQLHGPGTVEREFPGKFILFKRYGINISKVPMLVGPTLHYQNGGLAYDSKCETVLPGLYSAGEVSGGVHGENRLMGNSLLDVTVFGRIAGREAAQYAKDRYEAGTPNLEHVHRFVKERKEAGLDAPIKSPILLPDYLGERVKDKRLAALD